MASHASQFVDEGGSHRVEAVKKLHRARGRACGSSQRRGEGEGGGQCAGYLKSTNEQISRPRSVPLSLSRSLTRTRSLPPQLSLSL